jgi:hypothetical protein
LIKEIIQHGEEDDIIFPKTINYCESLGEPIYKIVIDKMENDFYIDDKGWKWVRVKGEIE